MRIVSFTTVRSGSCLALNTPHVSNSPELPRGMKLSTGRIQFQWCPSALQARTMLTCPIGAAAPGSWLGLKTFPIPM
eukprot:7042315-Prymnesium_polylepis.2